MNEEKTQPKAVPLIERLRSVPKDTRLMIADGQFSSRSIPVGAWFHEAADALSASPSVNEEKTEAAGGVELLRRALTALDAMAGDINGFDPVDYPDEIATIEAVRRRVDGVPPCERPNLRSLWGGCKLGSGCQCTSATQQGECEHRAAGVALPHGGRDG